MFQYLEEPTNRKQTPPPVYQTFSPRRKRAKKFKWFFAEEALEGASIGRAYRASQRVFGGIGKARLPISPSARLQCCKVCLRREYLRSISVNFYEGYIPWALFPGGLSVLVSHCLSCQAELNHAGITGRSGHVWVRMCYCGAMAR